MALNSSCKSDKRTLIKVIEENRGIVLGSVSNPGGAANWVKNPKRFTIFLLLFQVSLFYISIQTNVETEIIATVAMQFFHIPK